MPKILKNRISKTLSEADITAAKDAIKVLTDILTTPVAITDDDYKALANLGDVLKPIYDEVLEVAEESPSYLEDEQSLEEVKKDKTYFEQLSSILKPLNNLVFLYEREQGTAGAEYRNAMLNYESNVKTKAKKGNAPEAQLVLDKLNRIDRTPRLKPKTPTPPTIK